MRNLEVSNFEIFLHHSFYTCTISILYYVWNKIWELAFLRNAFLNEFFFSHCAITSVRLFCTYCSDLFWRWAFSRWCIKYKKAWILIANVPKQFAAHCDRICQFTAVNKRFPCSKCNVYVSHVLAVLDGKLNQCNEQCMKHESVLESLHYVYIKKIPTKCLQNRQYYEICFKVSQFHIWMFFKHFSHLYKCSTDLSKMLPHFTLTMIAYIQTILRKLTDSMWTRKENTVQYQ